MSSKRILQNWLSGYAKYTRHSESPDLFHFWTGVFTIAGALRRQVWIDQRYFQWTPNFYIVLVGPPGIAAKSTSLRLGTSLLQQIPGIVFGPKSMTWQGLTDALQQASAMVPYGDEYREMSCVTCSVNELGTFLRPDDMEMTDVLVDLWDGQLEKWQRRTKGLEGRVEIVNPWINVMGCTTPAWLQKNFTEDMIGGGLTSRVVFVYGDQKRRFIAYPSEEFESAEFNEESQALVHDLQLISEMKGEYELTKEAKSWGVKWYKRHWSDDRPDHMVSDRYGGYIARKQTHIHKLAIVLAAAARDELFITEVDLDLADKMTTGLEASMSKVFESIGMGEISRYVTEILAYVRAYGEISDQVLWRHMLPIMGPKEYGEATGAAVKAGYIRVSQKGMSLVYTAVREPKPLTSVS